MKFIVKIFVMLFGVILIVLMATILNNVTNLTCEPVDLYSGENAVVGFGGGFVNGLYDSMCMTLIEANNAVWNAYANWFVGLIGQRGNVAGIGADLWGLASFFCVKHSNFEYATGPGVGAVTDTEVFKELFLYELERCWTMFEGDTNQPLPSRHPLGKNVYFDCAEIIYDFTIPTGPGEFVSFGELTARLLYENSCGEQVNAPISSLDREYCTGSYFDAGTGQYVEGGCVDYLDLLAAIKWCAPKDEMIEYWGAEDNYYREYEEFVSSGGSIITVDCPLESITPKNFVEHRTYESSACFNYDAALCSFANVSGYNRRTDYEASNDGSTVIDGCGRIVISYIDYFDWGSIFAAQRAGDDYLTCGGLDVWNNFVALGSDTWPSVGDNIFLYNTDSIIICYEKFDTCGADVV
ncbi:MAG: hypothetical protein JW791_00935 [Nanoarchaeota archaeon]|nr:hypothetical protein [Nanoarchaeota archaeon]